MINAADMYNLRTKNISYDKKAIKDLANGSVLEVGTGTGRLIDILVSSNQVNSYTGIELNKDMVNIAKTKHSTEEIINDNFSTYNFNKKFDTILFSFNVINEFISIEEKIGALKKAKELINKNGKIILFFPIHDFDAWKDDFKEFTWKISDDNNDNWKVFLQIKRNLIDQISECYIKYQKGSTIIEDTYKNSLMTKNELLIMFNLLNLTIEKQYPILDDNMVFILKAS